FAIDNVLEDYNYVCAADLNNFSDINPSNKSYILQEHGGKIIEIVEKRVISSIFSVGGYFFSDYKMFRETFEKMNHKTNNELYLSEIITNMISNGAHFVSKRIDSYIDWGTVDEWRKYTSRFKVYFLDIDGVIFHNSAQYFAPTWGETEPLINNVSIIKKLKKNGNQIILCTSRTEEFRDITVTALEEIELEYDFLLMGCYHGQRVIVNDYTRSNPYPSAIAVNIARDADNLSDYLY
ncbi:MAG: hypothetical protein LBQ68_04815, partial [Clostridiales bacterium]|nr:hypothetical protein [Clostridiales bacterium]